jgi:tRNA modification GTPase
MADTIFALSSGRPPAAISVIRVSGPAAHVAARKIAGKLPECRTAAVRELKHPVTGALLDEALVLRFDAPASATSEDIVEFQCHGGRAVVDALLSVLGTFEGLREAEPGEFTRRAFENGRIDLTEAEGLADLLEAETEMQRRAALALAEGGLKKQIAEWQEQLLALSAQAERAIDYDEEDERLDPALVGGCDRLAADLAAWLERPRIELLKDGVRVVIAGPPNAGKSSLINALTGTNRSIVTDVPGTTRDHVDVPISLAGVPVLLTDTAGLRNTFDEVEAIGVARTEGLLRSADVLLWLGEASSIPTHPRALAVHAKVDLPDRMPTPPGSVAVSSLTGQGIGALLEEVGALASSVLPHGDTISLNRRQVELIAEARTALVDASEAAELVLVAEGLRAARSSFDRLTGRAGVEDVLDSLFGRFCLGK